MQKNEGQSVSGERITQPAVVVGRPKRGMQSRKKVSLIAGLLIIVIAVAVIAVVAVRNDRTKTLVTVQQKTVCTKGTIAKASEYITAANTYDLGLLLEKDITSKADYRQDINCLYAVISYNFLNNIATGIDTEIDNYTELYVQGIRPSAAYGSAMSAAEVKAQAAAIRKVNDAYSKQSEATDGDSIVGKDGVYPQ